MVQWITKNFTAHRYRPLLYVEWVIGIVALSFFVAPSQWMQPDGQSLYSGWFWVLWGVLFIIFMAAGLAHPTKPAVKAAYLSGLLLMVVFLTEGGLHGVEAFLIIILLRSSLLYRTATCIGWAGLLLIIYAGTLFLAYQQFVSFPDVELIDPIEMERVARVLQQSDEFSSSTMVLIGSLSDVLPSYQFIKIYFIEKTVSFGLILLFVLLIAHSYKNERDSRQKLAAAYAKAQSKVATIATEAAETERDRIARDIHDTLGHALTDQYLALQNTAEALRKNDYASVEKLVSQGNSAAKHALCSYGRACIDCATTRSTARRSWKLLRIVSRVMPLMFHLPMDGQPRLHLKRKLRSTT